jgi:hypothetical protein
MRITALDLAATTGIAFGELPGKPTLETWALSGGGRGDRGLRLMRSLKAHLKAFDPERVYIERPLSAAVMVDIGASLDTQVSLSGYVFLAETVCASCGIETRLVDAQEVRKHFVGRARFPIKGEGKRAVFAQAKRMGWNPQNDNESDAAALWDFGSANSSPAAFLMTTGERPARVR